MYKLIIGLLIACCMTGCSTSTYTIEETFGPAHITCEADGSEVYAGLVSELINYLNERDEAGEVITIAELTCIVTLEVTN